MCEIKDEFIDCNTVCGIHTGKENQQTIIGALDFYCFISQNVSHAFKITRRCYSLMRKVFNTKITRFSYSKSFCLHRKIVIFI